MRFNLQKPQSKIFSTINKVNSFSVSIYKLNRLLLSKVITLSVATAFIFGSVSTLHASQKKSIEPWSFLHPYVANYALISDGDKLGNAQRKLSLNGKTWNLSSSAKLSKYFLKLKSHEYTSFSIQNSKLLTHEFNSSTKITFKKEKKMKQVFDIETGIENGTRGKKSWQISHEKPVYDRVSHLVQLRSDLLNGKTSFNYNVSYKGKLQQFSYLREADEMLDTKMGTLNTVKLVRTKQNGDIFSLWLSQELNYVPVKIAQYEKDKADITMLLESLDYTASSQANQ